jgi:membrane protein
VTAAERVRRFLAHDLWRAELDAGALPARLRGLLQFAVMVGEGFVRDRLLLHASALTYMTALSVVPLLAVALSIAEVFVGDRSLAQLAVEQLTVGSPAAREQLLGVVENVNFGALGPLGAGFLLVTTVLAVRHAETAISEIWGVRHGRGWVRRFTDYLAVIVIAPLLTALALSLATALRSGPLVQHLLEVPAFATLYELGLRQAPVVFYAVAFSFLFWFLPNADVRVGSALVGGAVAALLFAVAQSYFVSFVLRSASYGAVFGGFAALPLLLFWIYVSWSVVLLGAEISFAYQNLANYRREAASAAMSPAEREALGLQLALELARSFREGRAPTAAALSESLDAPVRTLRDLLDRLEGAGLIVRVATADEREPGSQPARPLDVIHVEDVLGAVRGVREARGRAPAASSRRIADEVLDQLEDALAQAGLRRTLAELLDAEEGSA